MENLFFKNGVEKEDEWPWQSKARLELNEEDEGTTAEKLSLFKAKINEFAAKHEKFKPIMRETFLMAFLRCRKFDVEKAFSSYIGYFKIHSINPEKVYPIGKGPLDYPNVWKKPICTMLQHRNPIDGSFVTLWSYRNFVLNEDQLDDMYNAGLPYLMELFEHPSVQAYGLHFIFDNQGMTFAMFRAMIVRFYLVRTMVVAQGVFPTRLKGFHIMNEPYGLSQKLFLFIKPFLSSKIRDRVHFHGNDMSKLHKHIAAEILPEELGGTDGCFSAEWMKESLENVNDRVIENSYYGFVE